jgi:hypothetical protein
MTTVHFNVLEWALLIGNVLGWGLFVLMIWIADSAPRIHEEIMPTVSSGDAYAVCETSQVSAVSDAAGDARRKEAKRWAYSLLHDLGGLPAWARACLFNAGIDPEIIKIRYSSDMYCADYENHRQSERHACGGVNVCRDPRERYMEAIYEDTGGGCG